jgi:hypothetical protein
MRLLAHGGTLLGERSTIGSWPTVHPALLEEKYGLEGGKKILGAGIAGGNPFLIFRELQKNLGRLYAFTLLLDPGEAIWERFSWNAGALLEVILDAAQDAESVAGRMFSAPEKLRSSELEAWVGNIEAPARPSRPGPIAEQISRCLAGSIFVPECAALAPADLKMESRPVLSEMRDGLDALPQCLRVAKGWMSGGGIAQAQAFGAALVFDDEAPKATSNVRNLRDHGQKIVDLFRNISDVPGLEHSIENLAPLWTCASPVKALEELAPVAKWLSNRSEDAELIRKLSHEGATPFAEIVRLAARIALTEGRSKLDAETTRGVVRYFIQSGEPLGSVYKRLNDAALAEVIEQDHKGRPPASLGLPNYFRLNTRTNELRGLKAGIVSSLTKILAEEGWSATEAEELCEAAWQRSIALNQPLSEWRLLVNQGNWPGLTVSLRKEADRRAKERSSPAWLDDYLNFGGPVEAAAVVKGIPGEQIDAIARSALTALATSSSAEAFLSQLAVSAYRPKILAETKIAIAQQLTKHGDTNWRPFLAVWQLINDKDADPVAVEPAEANRLRAEIPELSKNAAATPNLVALMTWNGLLDQASALLLINSRKSNSPITPNWLRGIEIAKQKGWLSKESYQANVFENAENLAQQAGSWSLTPDDVDRGLLADRIYFHFFDHDMGNAERSRNILKAICVKWKNEPVLKEAMGIAIARGLNSDKQDRLAFSRRFFNPNPYNAEIHLGALFAAMPEERYSDMVAALFADESMNVLSLVSGIIKGHQRWHAAATSLLPARGAGVRPR